MKEWTSSSYLLTFLALTDRYYPINFEMTSNQSNSHYMGKSDIKFPETSGGTVTIQPKDLNIVWGGDNRYWNKPSDRGVAELYQVCWLEVTCCVDSTDPKKDYEVWFEVSFAPNAFGWGACPLYLMVKRGKDGKPTWTRIQVNPDEDGKKFNMLGRLGSSKKNTDRSSSDQEDKKIYFGLYEVWSGKWKGGLRIHNAYVKEV